MILAHAISPAAVLQGQASTSKAVVLQGQASTSKAAVLQGQASTSNAAALEGQASTSNNSALEGQAPVKLEPSPTSNAAALEAQAQVKPEPSSTNSPAVPALAPATSGGGTECIASLSYVNNLLGALARGKLSFKDVISIIRELVQLSGVVTIAVGSTGEDYQAGGVAHAAMSLASIYLRDALMALQHNNDSNSEVSNGLVPSGMQIGRGASSLVAQPCNTLSVVGHVLQSAVPFAGSMSPKTSGVTRVYGPNRQTDLDSIHFLWGCSMQQCHVLGLAHNHVEPKVGVASLEYVHVRIALSPKYFTSKYEHS